MKLSTSLALAMLLGGGVATAGAVVPVPRPDDVNQTEAPDAKQEMGLVVAVDAASGMLRIKDEKGKIRRFSAKKAKVHAMEGKIISLADISVGDTVSVSYEMSVKGREALEIHRHRRAAKK